MSAVAGIGRSVIAVLSYLGELGALLRRSVASSFALTPQRLGVVARVTSLQLLYSGSHAVLPLTIASVALGLLVLSQTGEYLPGDVVQTVSGPILVREVVPIVTVFLLIGRSGTAITIEVANMKLNDELSALQVMGIRLEHFVVLPRLIGMVVSFAALEIYATVAALVGGYLTWTATLPHGAPFPLLSVFSGLEFGDLVVAVTKGALFGVVVSMTAIQQGLAVEQSRREIPIVTTRAVVRSLLLCFLLNTGVSLVA